MVVVSSIRRLTKLSPSVSIFNLRTSFSFPSIIRNYHHHIIFPQSTHLSPNSHTTTDGMQLPTTPKSAFTSFGKSLQESLSKEYSDIQEEIIQAEQKKDQLYALSRNVLKNAGKVMFGLRTGESTNIAANLDECEKFVNQMVDVMGVDQPRDVRFTATIERYAEAKMFHYFFSNGVLAPPTVMKPCNDEEYIGAALGFAQELTRYVVGRATEADVSSITICHELIVQLNGKMLEIDFRNGHLRRKYDGLKYAIKTIEEIIFELSLVNLTSGDQSNHMGDDQEESEPGMPIKRLRLENKTIRIDVEGVNSIRDRMDVYDKEREKVIKLSREAQKLSKQSIYSIHRGELVQAQEKADGARAIIMQMNEQVIQPHPSLRYGSFAGCVEEWAEGVLFLEWCRSKRILTKTELGSFINTAEYIGALSDFTGEIGRTAVNYASQRNIDAVRAILQADLIISSYLSQFNVSGNYTKKLSAVNMNYKKIEDILYELTLQRMGGKALRRDPEPVADETTAVDE